ncbi:MAG: hypothetical protein U1D67_05225 [Dehalococcoidia bacterium]|nr:hypothetical protein [Dehalococcoidia bacterium]
MTDLRPSLPLKLFSQAIRSDPAIFINEILGLPVHSDQLRWLRGATRKINILRPGNRWGKSLIEACLHIYQGIIKPNLADLVSNEEEWDKTPYETLNFGPGYEQARGSAPALP